MKITRVWATMGFLLAPLSGGAANTQNTRFDLANNTAYAVHSVYIWPTGTTDLRQDRLGNYILQGGQSLRVEPHDGGCMYNIRVVLEDDGAETQWDNVNLCDLSIVILNYDDQNGGLSASTR